jgi:tetratricopeptide (TPR) repeat protein
MNLRARSLVLAACVVGSAACSSSGSRGLPPAGGFVQRGEEALNAGRLDEARQLFLEAAADTPRSFLAWIGVARTAIARGDRADLDRALTEAMAHDVGTPESADLLGRTFLTAARAQRPFDTRLAGIAVGYFRRAAASKPDLSALRFHTGLAAWTSGDQPLAVASLEAAHAAAPADWTTLRALLDLHRERGDKVAVRRLLDGVVARTGSLPPALEADRLFGAEPRL